MYNLESNREYAKSIIVKVIRLKKIKDVKFADSVIIMSIVLSSV